MAHHLSGYWDERCDGGLVLLLGDIEGNEAS